MKFLPVITSIHKVIVTLLMLIVVSGCGADRLDYRDLPVEQLYTEAQKYSDRGQWLFAAIAYDEVERQHPYSIWADAHNLCRLIPIIWQTVMRTLFLLRKDT